MNALLSIKPRYAASILDGTKHYEYRKSIFAGNNINKVYIYASSPIKKVIGEFKVVSILCDTPQKIWQRTHKESGLSKAEFFDYFDGKDRGYAIQIMDFERFNIPLSLKCKAPQSFRYFEEVKEICYIN